MKILVTGGAGFIGSHLCNRLLNEGHSVVCLDNLLTGAKRNIQPFLKNSRFRFLRHDITKPLFLSGRLDQIYNLACPASPPHYQHDPLQTIRVNTIGMMNVLELGRKKRARILQASTSEIYGDPLEHPQKESYRGNVNILGPRACYDEGKRIAETLCIEYHREAGVDVRIARIFNTYGPGMALNDGRVVSNFIIRALQGKPLPVYGTGKQTRSFCYVEDLVEGLIRLMASTVVAQPINLGNPKEFTVNELARIVLTFTKSKSTVVRHPLPIDDPRQRRPDITLAKKILGWQPTISLEEGLQKSIPYFAKLV